MAISTAGSLVRVLATCGVAAFLAGCPRTPPQRSPSPPAPVAPSAPVRGATIFELDPQASAVHVLVYKGGALARLGHNHVMTVQGLHGRVWSHAEIPRSGFDFSFPVAQMLVDEPAARSAAGSEFPGEIPDADREATRRNMLRAEVLDAAQYPEIRVRSAAVAGSASQPRVTARITIRNVSRDLTLTPNVSIEGDRITVSGELDISQTDFGITPFSAALGALQVQDRLHVQFRMIGKKQ